MSFNCFMHERNIYKDKPDFNKLALEYPEFREYVLSDKKGKFRIDFSDPNALRTLTRILLKKDFDLNVEIPGGFLIPTVPQRLNYILWIEDLLTVLPKESELVSGIDIGTGPCAILSLLGSKKNGWHFVSTETSEEAVQWAEKNIEKNQLDSHIKVAKVNKGTVLQDILDGNETVMDFCVCNPPFFEDKDDIRKKSSRMKEKLHLFAKKEEIFSDGGEVSFVKQLLKDSLMYKSRIGLYSSMFGKKKSFLEMLKELQAVEGVNYTKTEFCQGNTIRWGIAWTFKKDVNFKKIERPKPKKDKHKKPKPPLVYSITRTQKDGNILCVPEILKNMKSNLLELQIQTKIIKSAVNYAEIEILSYKNTWSHQRRKRREIQKGAVHEISNTSEMKECTFSSRTINESNLSDAIQSKQLPNSKNLQDSEFSYADLEQEQTSENEAKTSLLPKTVEEQGDAQNLKPSSISLNMHIKMEKANSESLGDPVSQKRKREEDKYSLNINSDIPQDQGNKSVQKNPDVSASPKVKKIKISEDVTFYDDNESKILCGGSQKRKRDEEEHVLDVVSGMLNDQDKECVFQKNPDESTSPIVKRLKIEDTVQEINLETVQTNHQDKTFKIVPLLYCILKLRTNKENILLEMNCPPEFNRETMYQLFQHFRNKFG